jgi:hypothetical protein
MPVSVHVSNPPGPLTTLNAARVMPAPIRTAPVTRPACE